MVQLEKVEHTQTDWIDLHVLSELEQDIGADVLLSIIHVYLAELDEHVEKMQLARQQDNWVVLGKLAHCIKSSSGSLGALPLYQTALNIELLCRQDAGEKCLPELSKFFDFVEPTREVLQAYLKR